MLSQNSRQSSALSGEAKKAEQDAADIEALRAAYWAVVTASAHADLSNRMPRPSRQPISEPIYNAYQAAVAAFANSVFNATGISPEAEIPYSTPSIQKMQQQAHTLLDLPQPKAETLTFKLPDGQTSQWIPEAVRPRRTARSSRQLPKPIIRKSGEQPTASQRMNDRVQTSRSSAQPLRNDNANVQPVAGPSQTTANKKEMNQKVQQFLNEYHPASAPARQEKSPIHPVQPHSQEAETEMMLNMFQEEALIESLPSDMKNGWLSKALNRPKIVTGIIGLCLLASSVYAGLGYWWLSATSVQAAEPNSSVESSETPRNNGSLLKNIESLQNETNIIIPNEQADMEETLLAQATPAKSFTMAELKSELTGPTGRPDPFSPLIQEGTSTFSPLEDPKKKKDILLDVQYTGFIGDVNSKDKVAIIRINDPAGGTKTLIKKAGDSFYVDGERIVLNAIARNNLSLRVSGANRSLSLNPYQEITTASAASGGTPTASATTGSSGNGTPTAPASPASGSQNSNPAVPTLQEPSQ